MLFRIFSFELYYRFQRSATYVYFFLLFALSFIVITSPTAKLAGAIGHVQANAPFVLSQLFLVLSLVMTMISSAVMGFAMVRDAEHNIEGILFTTRAQKFEYLLGRFAGSLTILFLMGIGAWLGLVAGYALGPYMPWEVTWKHSTILPQNFWHYLQPFMYFMMTNLFISGVFFFVSGALIRNAIVLYSQGILILLLYQLSTQFLLAIESKDIAAIVDPFGIISFVQVTQYWTPVEKNTMLVPFAGLMMWNRILWMGLALVGLVLTYFSFSFKVGQTSLFTRVSGKRDSGQSGTARVFPVPRISSLQVDKSPVTSLARSSWLYFRMVTQEIPFLAVVVCGMVVFLVNATKMTDMYGTSSHATTFAVLKLIESFNLFLFIIAVFYSGELMWMEQRHNFHQITRALPVSGLAQLVSKLLGLSMVYFVLIVMLILAGIGVQVAYGYYKFEPGVYVGTLFGSTFTAILLFTFLCFFIQALVRNKFLGFVLSITLILGEAMAINAGLESDFLLFAGGNLGVFSDMNGYGHHVLPFAWLRLYWLAFGVILFLLSIAAWSQNGTTFTIRSLRNFWSNTGITLLKPILVSVSVLVAAFIVLHYNGRILNSYESKTIKIDRGAEYERTLKKYDSIVQPKIVEVSLVLNLEPSRRDFTAYGHYILKNKSQESIPVVHLQFNQDSHLKMDTVSFDRSSKTLDKESGFRYQRYAIDPPLLPGDSMRMNFALTFTTRGFELRGSNDQIAYNGTFLNQSYFPALGYSSSLEIQDVEERLKYRLGSRRGLSEPQSLRDRNLNQYGDDADHVRFDVVIGTEGDQLAIAPGRLQRTWKENDRNYFHYKMEAPMGNFYSILSGRYAVRKVDWNGISLEVYHHPEHDFNVDRMLEGMKEALSFCSEHFGAYPHKAIRIVEFPRYANYAQSFAQTIPYSEGIGFIFKVRDTNKDLDMAYYATAHEVAHQWWGQMIMQSNTRGGGLLSEGLAQYSALMVMKQKFPPEIIERYLRYELGGYLVGRSTEREKEETLADAEGKNYLHYSKASLAFFAFQDYIGEDQVNRALGNFAARWAMRDAPYPTSLDLIAELRAVTPDSLQYLIKDLFESITLYENVAMQCYFEKMSGDQHEVSLKVGTRKILADSIGRETELPLADWIDIGIYGRDSSGLEKLIYLQKHKITRRDQVINLTVRGRPVRAGIDPLHKLIDRHPDDNKIEAKEVVDLATLPVY